MKLRTKLVVVLVVLSFVLGASLYGGVELYKQQVTEREEERAAETAAIVAAQVDATVAEKRDFVGFAASRPEAAAFGRADRFARGLATDSRFYAVQVVAANGTVVAFDGDVTEASRERTVGSDAGDQPYVRSALAGETHVSDPEVASTGQHIVVLSAPIVEDDAVVGVLAAALYVDTSTLLTPVEPLPSDRRAVVVTAGSETLYEAGPAFERSVAAEARVTSTGWTVRVTRDRAALDALLREVGAVQAVGVLSVLLLVSLVGGWQYRTTVSQMRRLRGAFDAAGRGEYDQDLSLSGGDEWNHISTGFTDLLDELADREHVLERRRQRLEVLNRVLRHNLRNDVGVILGYADTLRDDDGTDRTRAVEAIHGRARSLADLGDTARETQRLMVDGSLDPEPIDVGSALVDVVDDVTGRFPEVRVDVDVSAPVYATAVPRIDAALEHVCENACVHNDAETPTLAVSLSPSDDRVRVTVADNGPGIPSHELDVLDRGRETPLEHGSGLGLWLVKWAVDGSGGDLTFEPNEPRGTVVTIDLESAAVSDDE